MCFNKHVYVKFCISLQPLQTEPGPSQGCLRNSFSLSSSSQSQRSLANQEIKTLRSQVNYVMPCSVISSNHVLATPPTRRPGRPRHNWAFLSLKFKDCVDQFQERPGRVCGKHNADQLLTHSSHSKKWCFRLRLYSLLILCCFYFVDSAEFATVNVCVCLTFYFSFQVFSSLAFSCPCVPTTRQCLASKKTKKKKKKLASHTYYIYICMYFYYTTYII